MSRGLVVRLLLSVAAVTSVVLMWLPAFGIRLISELPLNIERGPEGVYVIRARNDTPLPPLLRDGDVLAIRDLRPADRAALLTYTNIPVGTRINVAVFRSGRLLQTSVTSIALPTNQWITLPNLIGLSAGMSLMLALALLILWRGRNWAAWGLCTFALATIFQNGLFMIPAPPLVDFWIQLTRDGLNDLVAIPALYVAAESLAYSGLSEIIRKRTRVAVTVLVLSSFGLWLAARISATYFGAIWSETYYTLISVLSLALFTLVIFVLLTGYRRATHESRLRIRWVLWSAALFGAALVVQTGLDLDRHPYWMVIEKAMEGLAMLGFLYAVLRARLVDVSFVIDRALVYTLITALLFGVFSLLEYLLHRMAVSENLSLALQAVTALLLAVALSPLHRRIERWIEWLFFRQQRRAVAALRRFAAECAFVERYEHLLHLAVENLVAHGAGAAVYERSGTAYQRRAARGNPWPEMVDADDPAFVALRARHLEVDLDDVNSALGADGLAYPMTVGERLTGAVVCRPRDGQQFAPDERTALAEAARTLGMSLYLLRDREQARLVADIAAGRVDEAAARQRALGLIEAPS